jgi:hypothetical protein
VDSESNDTTMSLTTKYGRKFTPDYIGSRARIATRFDLNKPPQARRERGTAEHSAPSDFVVSPRAQPSYKNQTLSSRSQTWLVVLSSTTALPTPNLPARPRRLRTEFEGVIYHVMARGNARENTVRDDRDRLRLIDGLGQTDVRWVLESIDYIFMIRQATPGGAY